MADSTHDALARLLKLLTDSHQHDMLMAATRSGDVELVQRILQCLGPGTVLQTTKGGRTACMEAARDGHAHVLEVLLKAHSPEQQVMQGDRFGMTAAMYAALRGHLDAFMQLMAYAPQQQLMLTNEKGWTVLQYAASFSKRADIVREVLSLAADPQQLVSHSNHSGRDALSNAAICGDDETLQLLLPYNTGTAQLTKALQSSTLLTKTFRDSHKRCCQLLFAQGASLEGLGSKQRQLIEAALRESVAAQLVPDAVTQAVNDAVVQLASAVSQPAAKRAKTKG